MRETNDGARDGKDVGAQRNGDDDDRSHVQGSQKRRRRLDSKTKKRRRMWTWYLNLEDGHDENGDGRKRGSEWSCRAARMKLLRRVHLMRCLDDVRDPTEVVSLCCC